MNEEELKQLKKGEKILIEAEFWGVHADGDIQFGFPCKTLSGGRQMTGEYVIPEHVSRMLKKPKCDPCRLFKKGDKVEYSLRDGRDFFDVPWVYDTASVIEEEDRAGMVGVRFTFNYGEPSVHKVPWFYLQLVTPVEELEPYSVEESTDYFSVDKGEEELSLYWKDKHPHPKESAEAERDRLNAEYRKGKE